MKKQLLYNSLVILNCTDSPYSENSPYLIFSNSKADPQHLKPKGATEPAWERCFLSITVVLTFCCLLLLSLIRILLWGGKWMLPSYNSCPIREAGHWNWDFKFVRLSHFFFSSFSEMVKFVYCSWKPVKSMLASSFWINHHHFWPIFFFSCPKQMLLASVIGNYECSTLVREKARTN